MKALTLHQPYASLISLGVKVIETRSWSTDYRGPLLIHAGAKSCPTGMVIGQWQTSYHRLTYPDRVDEGHHLTRFGNPEVHDAPLGAVVASCTLADVVRMTDTHSQDAYPYLHVPDRLLVTGPVEGLDLDQEIPYGDFAGGRFAWLLEDVKATTQRCPACWKMAGGPNGGVAGKDWSNACPVCIDVGRCDPIPAKGHQRLWEWTP